MKTMLFFVGLFLLSNVAFTQNYYVASLNGEVYYQNKLLKKKDKVTPKGNIRFKKSDGYVKLSGPGGLYTLSAKKARPMGSEFLLTLSSALFPPVRPISTLMPSASVGFYPGVLLLWNFGGHHFTFFDETKLYIDPARTSDGQMIGFLHETNMGLVYRKADIQKDSLLVIHADNFEAGTKNVPQSDILKTLIIQTANSAVLDTLLANYITLDPILEAVAAFEQGNTDAAKAKPAYQVLDNLGSCQFINKRAFLKDMRFHIKKTRAKSQDEFLEAYEFNDYITETYAFYRSIYQLPQVLANDLGLPPTE